MTKRTSGKMVRVMIVSYIRWYFAKHQYPPSIRDIKQTLNISSTSVVNYHLDRLVEEKKIERDPGVARGIRLVVHEAVPQPTATD